MIFWFLLILWIIQASYGVIIGTTSSLEPLVRIHSNLDCKYHGWSSTKFVEIILRSAFLVDFVNHSSFSWSYSLNDFSKITDQTAFCISYSRSHWNCRVRPHFTNLSVLTSISISWSLQKLYLIKILSELSFLLNICRKQRSYQAPGLCFNFLFTHCILTIENWGYLMTGILVFILCLNVKHYKLFVPVDGKLSMIMPCHILFT